MKKIIIISLLAGAFLASAKEKVVMEIELAKIKKFEVKAHVNEKNAPPPKGSSIVNTPRGLKFHYVFPSKKHDALMAAFPVKVPAATKVKVELSTKIKGHRPYLILVDAGNEFHYMSIHPSDMIPAQAIKTTGKLSFTAPLPLKNRFRGERHARHWGGDDNQRIDFPLKKIYIGLNDYPDAFVGKGEILFHKIQFLAPEKRK